MEQKTYFSHGGRIDSAARWLHVWGLSWAPPSPRRVHLSRCSGHCPSWGCSGHHPSWAASQCELLRGGKALLHLFPELTRLCTALLYYVMLDTSRSVKNAAGILTGITLNLQANLRIDLLILLRPPIHKHSYLLSSTFMFLEINNLRKGMVKLFHFSVFSWRINGNVFPWYFLFLLSFWNATDIFFLSYIYIQTLSG